jgi:hypothetical protein
MGNAIITKAIRYFAKACILPDSDWCVKNKSVLKVQLAAWCLGFAHKAVWQCGCVFCSKPLPGSLLMPIHLLGLQTVPSGVEWVSRQAGPIVVRNNGVLCLWWWFQW